LIYGSDDVVVEPGVVQLDGCHMPVTYRIGSISPDDRRSEEQVLEHITGALQEAIRQPNGAVRAAVSRANEQASVRSSHSGSGLRGFIGLMLTAGFIIAFAWYSYSSEAKLIMARWAPRASLASLLSLIKPQDQTQPNRAATANEAASKAVTVAQNVPQEARAKDVSTATDMAEWLQTAARDLANAEQAIQQLKASQEQIVRDNAELAERLKATEEQVARDNATVADRLTATEEQVARDKAAVAERLTATEAQMARDHAQNVEELKAAQSQMAHDNAALSSELKAALEQMKGAIAKASKPTERASEQNPPPKPSRQIVTGTIRRAVRAPQVRAPQATHQSSGFGQL
jgi:hypothetical protein